jgi:hypothetical protein
VSQNYISIAQRSFQMLLEIIDGETYGNERPEVLFEGTLVLRASA